MIRRLIDLVDDIGRSFNDRSYWMRYAYADVRRIYSRTRFGFIWELASPATFIFGIGFAYSRLRGDELGVYLPYLAIGYILWLNMQLYVIGSTTLFAKYRSSILGRKRPIYSFILRHFFTGVLYTAMHVCLFLPIVILFHEQFRNFQLLWLLAYLGLYVLSAVGVITTISILCLRLPDLTPFIGAVNRLAFFVTPIIWMERDMGRFGEILIAFNPYATFIVGIRDAVLGRPVNDSLFLQASALTVVLLFLGPCLLAWSRKKISLWVS